MFFNIIVSLHTIIRYTQILKSMRVMTDTKTNKEVRIYSMYNNDCINVYLTLHRQNKTGRNTAIAIVMGMNQLSSDAYGSFIFGPEVRLNLTSCSSSSPESSFSESISCESCSCMGGTAGTSAELCVCV